MGGSSSSSSRRRSSLHFKVLFGALALAGVIFLFLVYNQESGRGKMGAPTSTSTSHSAGNFKHADVLGRDKLLDHPDLDFNYMSKRRVPNGPDPIHNRYI
jgi:hypothetical protein